MHIAYRAAWFRYSGVKEDAITFMKEELWSSFSVLQIIVAWLTQNQMCCLLLYYNEGFRNLYNLGSCQRGFVPFTRSYRTDLYIRTCRCSHTDTSLTKVVR